MQDRFDAALDGHRGYRDAATHFAVEVEDEKDQRSALCLLPRQAPPGIVVVGGDSVPGWLHGMLGHQSAVFLEDEYVRPLRTAGKLAALRTRVDKLAPGSGMLPSDARALGETGGGGLWGGIMGVFTACFGGEDAAYPDIDVLQGERDLYQGVPLVWRASGLSEAIAEAHGRARARLLGKAAKHAPAALLHYRVSLSGPQESAILVRVQAELVKLRASPTLVLPPRWGPSLGGGSPRGGGGAGSKGSAGGGAAVGA